MNHKADLECCPSDSTVNHGAAFKLCLKAGERLGCMGWANLTSPCDVCEASSLGPTPQISQSASTTGPGNLLQNHERQRFRAPLTFEVHMRTQAHARLFICLFFSSTISEVSLCVCLFVLILSSCRVCEYVFIRIHLFIYSLIYLYQFTYLVIYLVPSICVMCTHVYIHIYIYILS